MSASRPIVIVQIIISAGLIAAAGYFLIPRSEPTEVYSQSSLILEQGGDPFENKFSAPLSKKGTVQQRLWIPNVPISVIRIYVAAKEPLEQAPKLTVFSDESGNIGRELDIKPGHPSRYNEQLYQVDYPLPVNDTSGGWIWLSFTQDSSSTALRLIRQIDHTKHPGGRLIIIDPPRHQEQGVLAYTFLHPKKNVANLKLSSTLLLIAITATHIASLSRTSSPIEPTIA